MQRNYEALFILIKGNAVASDHGPAHKGISYITFFSDVIAIAFTVFIAVPWLLFKGTMPSSVIIGAAFGVLYALNGWYTCRKVVLAIGYVFLVGSLVAIGYYDLPFEVLVKVVPRQFDIFEYTVLLGGMTLLFLFLYLGIRLKKSPASPAKNLCRSLNASFALFVDPHLPYISLSFYKYCF